MSVTVVRSGVGIPLAFSQKHRTESRYQSETEHQCARQGKNNSETYGPEHLALNAYMPLCRSENSSGADLEIQINSGLTSRDPNRDNEAMLLQKPPDKARLAVYPNWARVLAEEG